MGQVIRLEWSYKPFDYGGHNWNDWDWSERVIEKEQKEWTFSSKPKLSSVGKDVRMGKDTARLCNWDQAKKTTNLHSFFSVLF